MPNLTDSTDSTDSTASSSRRSLLAKVRGRIRRMRHAAEEEEHCSGELNLVPYLDILVNTIIFLLATTASALPLSHINTTAPKEVPDDEVVARPGETSPGQQLKLTVAVSYRGFIVAGQGGVLDSEEGGQPTIRCRLPLKGGHCPAFRALRRGEWSWIDGYDYKKLTGLAQKIKAQHPEQRQVILTADRGIPYRVVIQAMDALRGKPTAKCTGDDDCLFDQVIFSAGVK